MRNRFFLVVLFLLLVCTIECVAQVVDIPDSNLRAVIEGHLNKRAGATITADEMASLWSIEAGWRNIRDVTGLEYAVNLGHLSLGGNVISDLSPLAGLVQLENLHFENMRISDLSWVSGLLKLRYLALSDNVISDLSPLSGLLRLENLRLRSNFITDISELAGLISLRDLNLHNNFITDVSPLLKNSGLGTGDRIWLTENPLNDDSVKKHIPALRRKGAYVSIAMLINHVPKGLEIGDEFTYDVRIEDVVSLGGWEGGIRYSADALELLSITYGSFLGRGNNVTSYPASGSTVDAAEMKVEKEWNENWVRGLSQVRLKGGVDGSGTLFTCRFRIVGAGPVNPWTDLRLYTFTGVYISYGLSREGYWLSEGASVDVNGDGKVDLADVVLIAAHIGTPTLEYDVDGSGWVNIEDMIYVVQRFGTTPRSPAAVSDMALPRGLTASMVKEWIDMAHAVDDGSESFRKGIAVFNLVLAMMPPKETVLLANYPNPLNPETWIPYHLAHDADVKLTIYDVTGLVVRRFDLGYQLAGFYTDRAKAVYWNGRNGLGEQVGTGVYFYHLSAGDYSQTRRMVILK